MREIGGAFVADEEEFDFREDGTVYIESVWTWKGMGIIRARNGEAYIVTDPETGLLALVEDEQED